MHIYNVTKDQNLAQEAKLAGTFFSRLVGLLNRAELPLGEGLIIKPCNSVHTCFMRFTIDVLFLNKDYRVVKIVENMVPNRFTKIIKDSVMVVELPSGVVRLTGTQVGDVLKFQSHIY